MQSKTEDLNQFNVSPSQAIKLSEKHAIGRTLGLVTLILAFLVIALGAYTRLTDSGLGCPDWPGCYGRLVVPQAEEHIAHANATYPARPVEHAKAWAEMVHRYLAGALGLCIFSLVFIHLKNKTPFRKLTTGMGLLVIMQAALGMWTVTLGLKPIIVLLHLLGGFTTFSLLLVLNIQQRKWLKYFRLAPPQALAWRPLFWLTCIVLVFQIALGGWTAANYSAAICTELPICQGDWAEHLNFSKAFKPWWHDIPITGDGTSAFEYATHLEPDAKITIHVMHRLGAFVATFLITLCVCLLLKWSPKLALGLGLALVSQVLLGVSNVVFQVPLFVAVAHNLVALVLLSFTIVSVFYLYHAKTIYKTGTQSHDFRNRKRTTPSKLSQPGSPSI